MNNDKIKKVVYGDEKNIGMYFLVEFEITKSMWYS